MPTRSELLLIPLALTVACGSPSRPAGGGVQLSVGDTWVEGTAKHNGSLVGMNAQTLGSEQGAFVKLDLDGVPLDVTLDLAGEMLVEDAHDATFTLEQRETFLALRNGLLDEHPELADTFVGRMLVKVADRYAEVPLGVPMPKHEVPLDPVKAMSGSNGCGDDGVTCLSGTSGSSYAIYTDATQCQVKQTAYGDSVCRGRCGMGCNWFDNDYTWDCLDHDVCLDYSNQCDGEFNEAADDWVATLAPLCWSGTTRTPPPPPPAPPVKKCGNGSLEGDEECDDGGNVSGDGCSDTCKLEVSQSTGQLVINEVDYDQPGTDGGEFVELYNGTASAVNLTNLVLAYVNGSGGLEYGRTVLSGTLPPGGYLVVCAQGSAPGICAGELSLPAGTLVLHFANATNNLQNGAPDGIALVDLVSGALLDAISYEGSIPIGTITELGTFDLVEGTPLVVLDSGTSLESICRFPNGTDTNDAGKDWVKRPSTPGAPNL